MDEVNKVDEAHEVDDGMYFSSKVSTKLAFWPMGTCWTRWMG